MHLHYIWPCVRITPLLRMKYMSCSFTKAVERHRELTRSAPYMKSEVIWEVMSRQLVNSYQCWAFIFVIKQPKSHSSDCLTLKMKCQDPSSVRNYLPIKMV